MPPKTVEELNQQYDRGVKYWEAGNGRYAFSSLDSLRKIELTSENASIKSKAMTYLAKCFYSKNNFRYAINYLNYSLLFGKDILTANERLEIYDMMVNCHHQTNNSQQELYYSQLKKSINDSIQAAFQVDSLKKALEAQKSGSTNTPTENKSTSTDSTVTNEGPKKEINSLWLILGGMIISGGIVFFILQNKNKSANSTKNKTLDIPKIDAQANKSANALIDKIAKVELVFIRAEVLGEFGNKKTVIKIINDYNEQLPLIIKNLDEAITTNDNEPIINALSYLKPYLTAFGMSATLAMLNEVEAESATEKTTKLLSRVFQIRNHIRRAHDETKALSEVLG